MDHHRWRLRFFGGMVLGMGAFLVPAMLVSGIVYREPLVFILLITATGWVTGGYVILRAATYTGKRLVGLLLTGLSIITIMTLLGAFVMGLAQ